MPPVYQQQIQYTPKAEAVNQTYRSLLAGREQTLRDTQVALQADNQRFNQEMEVRRFQEELVDNALKRRRAEVDLFGAILQNDMTQTAFERDKAEYLEHQRNRQLINSRLGAKLTRGQLVASAGMATVGFSGAGAAAGTPGRMSVTMPDGTVIESTSAGFQDKLNNYRSRIRQRDTLRAERKEDVKAVKESIAADPNKWKDIPTYSDSDRLADKPEVKRLEDWTEEDVYNQNERLRSRETQIKAFEKELSTAVQFPEGNI